MNPSAAEGMDAPGTTGRFVKFGIPAANRADDYAFQATIAGPGITAANNSGIWKGSGSVLVAQKGAMAPGAGSAVFKSFDNLLLNFDGEVAFSARLSDGSSGIWADTNQKLHKVATIGSAAPGAGVFKKFNSVVLVEAGQIAFLATVDDAGAKTGIYAEDKSGALALIVRTHGALNGKTVSALSFSATASVPASGMAYRVTYTNHSQEVIEFVQP